MSKEWKFSGRYQVMDLPVNVRWLGQKDGSAIINRALSGEFNAKTGSYQSAPMNPGAQVRPLPKGWDRWKVDGPTFWRNVRACLKWCRDLQEGEYND